MIQLILALDHCPLVTFPFGAWIVGVGRGMFLPFISFVLEIHCWFNLFPGFNATFLFFCCVVDVFLVICLGRWLSCCPWASIAVWPIGTQICGINRIVSQCFSRYWCTTLAISMILMFWTLIFASKGLKNPLSVYQSLSSYQTSCQYG